MKINIVKKKITTIGKLFLWSISIILLSNTLFFLLENISKVPSPTQESVHNLLYYIVLILILAVLAYVFVQYKYIRAIGRELWCCVKETRPKCKFPEGERVVPSYRSYYTLCLRVLSIMLIIAFVCFAIWGTIKLFKTYLIYKFLLNNNLLLIFIVVLALLQFAVRKHIILNQSWKKLSDVWLKFTGIPAISVGGFGVVGLVPELKNRIVKIVLNAEYVNLKLMASVYIITIIILGLAYLLLLLGRSISSDEDSNAPMKWFIPTFCLIWIGNLGIYTVFFDCIFLTLHAHIST